MSWQPACRSRPGSQYLVICGMENVELVLHFSAIQRLACRTISAFADILLSVYKTPRFYFSNDVFLTFFVGKTVLNV